MLTQESIFDKSILSQLNFQKALPSRYNIIIPLRGERALAFNTVSKTFALWNVEDLDLLKKVESGEMRFHDNELKEMVYGGYVVSNEMNELDRLNNQYQATRNESNRMTMTIAPTLGCNFGCDYCFQGADKPFDTMSQEVQDDIVMAVEGLTRRLKNFSVAWYGGEPLLARNLIYTFSERLIDVCQNAGVNYSAFMVTNGWFLTQEVAEELNNRGVKSIQVTLDGPAEYHDQQRALLSGKPTFDRVVKNLRDVAIHVPGIGLSIRVNIDLRNRSKIIALIDQLYENGLAGRKNFRLYFAPVEAMTEGCHSMTAFSLAKKEYSQLEADLYRYAFDKQLVELPFPPQFHGLCTATNPLSVVVVPNGDMHKCWDTVSWPNLSVGKISAYESITESAETQPWRDWTPFEDPVCKECKILPNCAGACSYKFVHNEKLRGEQAALPCPSWKYNINERLFLRAEKLGMVKSEDWDQQSSYTNLSTREEQYDEVTLTSNLGKALDSAELINIETVRAER